MQKLRTLHIAICLGAVTILLAFGWIGFFTTSRIVAGTEVAGFIVLGAAATALVGGATLRSKILPAEGASDVEAWATANQGKCVLFWAMLEGGVAMCGVAFFVGASPWIAGGIAAAGLGFLVSQSPGTLAGH